MKVKQKKKNTVYTNICREQTKMPGPGHWRESSLDFITPFFEMLDSKSTQLNSFL